jgi:hypothetical protein
MAPRSMCFGVRSRKLSNVGQSLDVTKSVLSRVPPWFGRHVKPLVPAALAVVITHQPALGPRGGLWPVLSLCVIHKEGLCPISGDIVRLMMMKERERGDVLFSCPGHHTTTVNVYPNAYCLNELST